MHLFGFIIRIFKSNVQQQIWDSDISTPKSYLKVNVSPYRLTNWFLHAVTFGSNPAHSTIFSPVFVLHCEGRERHFTTD